MMFRHRAWVVLAVAILFQAMTFGIAIYSFTFWVSPWSAEFGVGRGEVMTVIVTLQVVMGLLAPLAGRAIDRLPLRLLIIAGALCLAAGLALMARAGALWHLNVLYGTLVAAGLLLAGPVAGQALATRWFSRGRGMALGVVTTGTSIGGFFVPPLVTFLQEALGWRATGDVLALLVLLAIVPPVWWLVRDRPEDAWRGADGQAQTAAFASDAFSATLTTLDILRTRIFWLMVLALVPLATAFGGAQQNLAPYAEDLGVDAQRAAYLVSMMALVMVAAKVFFGAMADRWQLRTLLFLALGGLALAFAMMVQDLNYPMLMLVCCLLGFVAGGFLPLIGAMVSHNFDIRNFGQVMGLIGPFTALSAIGPWLAGYLRDTGGSYDAAWLLMGALLVPSAAATALMKAPPGPNTLDKP